MGIESSLKVGANPHDIPHPEQASTPSYSWVDGRLTNTHVTSRTETIWPEVWSSMSKCAQLKAKQHWETEKTKLQAARRMMENHEILPH